MGGSSDIGLGQLEVSQVGTALQRVSWLTDRFSKAFWNILPMLGYHCPGSQAMALTSILHLVWGRRPRFRDSEVTSDRLFLGGVEKRREQRLDSIRPMHQRRPQPQIVTPTPFSSLLNPATAVDASFSDRMAFH